MTIGSYVQLNRDLVEASSATVSPFDRGYLFAHAAYEVTSVYGGKFIDLERHLARLVRTLEGLEIPLAWSVDELAQRHENLRAANNLEEGLVYLQITAGDYGLRDFSGPEVFEPNLFMFTTEKRLVSEIARGGIHTISTPDTRWARRDLKTTQLLSQALAYRKARSAGSMTAIFVEPDGLVTEAASANVWMVSDAGVLTTRNLSSALLPGVTRRTIQQLIQAEGVEVEERAFTLDELQNAREAFTSSTGVVIAPILSVDDQIVGKGKPGPVTRAVQRAYYRYCGMDIAVEAPWAIVP